MDNTICFAIQRPGDGKYYCGKYEWTTDPSRAKLYHKRCHAISAMRFHGFAKYRIYECTLKVIDRKDYPLDPFKEE